LPGVFLWAGIKSMYLKCRDLRNPAVILPRPTTVIPVPLDRGLREGGLSTPEVQDRIILVSKNDRFNYN
jgi:hypothetical protein